MTTPKRSVITKKIKRAAARINGLTPIQTSAILLIEKGFSDSEISNKLSTTASYVHKIRVKMKDEVTADRYNVKNIEPDAHRAIKKLVNGEGFGTIEKVRCSTAFAAAKEILARTQPVIQVTMTENFNFSEIPEELKRKGIYNTIDISDNK
jgi:hypothetical protein